MSGQATRKSVHTEHPVVPTAPDKPLTCVHSSEHLSLRVRGEDVKSLTIWVTGRMDRMEGWRMEFEMTARDEITNRYIDRM